MLFMKVTLMMCFNHVYATITTKIKKSLGKGSDWITNLVIDHTISVSFRWK